MKPVKMITDPVAMELLGDDTRRRIIYLLRARELTISQIAEELRMTPQAIYHHIKKLLPAEMVEVTREERVDNFIETYYRATAEVFSFSWGTSGKNQAQAEQRLRDTLLSLDKLGIKVRVEEDAVARIIKTQGKIETFGDKEEIERLAASSLMRLSALATRIRKLADDWSPAHFAADELMAICRRGGGCQQFVPWLVRSESAQ